MDIDASHLDALMYLNVMRCINGPLKPATGVTSSASYSVEILIQTYHTEISLRRPNSLGGYKSGLSHKIMSKSQFNYRYLLIIEVLTE